MTNPVEKTKQAVEAVLMDLVGFEVENYHEHIVWLAYCDPHDIPEELETIIDYESLGRIIANEMFIKAFGDAGQDDLDIFWLSLNRPADVHAFAYRKHINLERLCSEKISRRNAPITRAQEALHIVHSIGAEAPKYFDALKYIVNGAEDVTVGMLENTLDMIDQVCADIGIELDKDEDGHNIYDIDAIIDKATSMANA